MEWRNEEGRFLLNPNTEKTRSERNSTDARNSFDSDRDRIIFSSPFRRLQDKAQVFPLDESDFIRTRLTHSLEVSSIAKSIGISVEKKLIDDGYITEKEKGYIPVILECAGLAHDLGNPPFGHYGEETIKNVFKDLFKNNTEANVLNDLQKMDFENFDGNCQTIRILTRLQCLNDKYGLHLTYATLATLMKYPMDSINGNKSKEEREVLGVAYKKFGYFQSEIEAANHILEQVGTKINDGQAYRHPLSYLLEAADDIAYSAADLEDGFKKKVINISDIKEVFKEDKEDKEDKEVIKTLNMYEAENQYKSEERTIQRFRIYLQGEMIKAVIETFIEKQDKILKGEFKDEILMESSAKSIREKLKYIANEKILSNEDIYKVELAGEAAIKYLLTFFIDALGNKKNFINRIIDANGDFDKIELDGRTNRIYNIISKDYRMVYEKRVLEILKYINEDENLEYGDKNKKIYSEILYNTYLLITDYISGMTDNYSIELYRRLKGIKIN